MVRSTFVNKLAAKLIPHRIWVQTAFLMAWLGPAGLRMHNICGPVFHCYACPLATFACPIGIIAQFSAIHVFPFIAIGTLVLTGSIFGTLLCGWACPFGFLQDMLAKIPTKKFIPPQWTGHLRYVVLAVAVVAVPYLFGEDHFLFVCRLCPAGALEKALPDVVTAALTGKEIPWPNAIKITVIVLFFTGVLLVRRPWCKMLCPLGAIFGVFNRFSVFSMRIDEDGCTKCKSCHKLCDIGLKPDQQINAPECIRCLECIKCPPKAISAETVFDPILQEDQTDNSELS